MSKYGCNDVGSLVLDRASVAGGGGNKLYSLSFRSFRWRLIDTISCGGSSRYRYHHAAADKSLENSSSEIVAPVTAPSKKGEKLSELLKETENEISEREIKRKEESLEVMKRVVRKLQNEEERDRVEGAREVRKLAKEDTEARVTLSMLGSIPPLVRMLDLENAESKVASLYALLNLGIGNALNKAAIVNAGAVHKMLKLIDSSNGSCNLSVAEAVVANFLGLSALDSNKPFIGSSGAIPFLVKILQDLDSNRTQAKQDSLRALYNLSISPSNIPFMLETDLVPFLMNTLGDMEMSERILSILSNLVSTPEGRKAISHASDAFPILIDVLYWPDSPGCQEKASYILMVMAHKAYGDRQAMIEAGITSALLELTLLGSTLAQKRASRILECLRVEKGKQVSENYNGADASAAVSAPICGSSSSVDSNQKLCLEEEGMMSEERKAVKQLVQQSLQNNMRRIVKRANLPQDFVPSEHFMSLTNSSTSKSSTSKSLPF